MVGIPLPWRVVTGSVVEYLAGANHPVAVLAELEGQGGGFGAIWEPPVTIAVEAGGRRAQSGHYGSARGAAKGGDAMSIGEEHSFIRKSVNVWRVDPALVAVQATDPVPHVVNGEEEDIWLGRCIKETDTHHKQSGNG